MKKGILFDLDGTLWDSAEGVADSWNDELARMGRPERRDAAWVHGIMGKTMDQIAIDMFPRETPAEAERLLNRCLLRENAWLEEKGGVLYPGLEETLKKLLEAGYFLAIVSNCQDGYIEAFLNHHGLAAYFRDTECFGRTREGKGANIRRVVARNRLESAFYLGDTMGDLQAAREAGIPFLHAAYGFGTVPEGTPAIREIRQLLEAAEAFFRA